MSGAEIVQGVRFARNRVHHQWSDALKLDEVGFTFPMTLPLVFFEWCWRAVDDLPEPEGERHKDPGGEEIYRQQLEGRPARITLDALTAVFHFLRQVLEPSSLRRAPNPPVMTGA